MTSPNAVAEATRIRKYRHHVDVRTALLITGSKTWTDRHTQSAQGALPVVVDTEQHLVAHQQPAEPSRCANHSTCGDLRNGVIAQVHPAIARADGEEGMKGSKHPPPPTHRDTATKIAHTPLPKASNKLKCLLERVLRTRHGRVVSPASTAPSQQSIPRAQQKHHRVGSKEEHELAVVTGHAVLWCERWRACSQRSPSAVNNDLWLAQPTTKCRTVRSVFSKAVLEHLVDHLVQQLCGYHAAPASSVNRHSARANACCAPIPGRQRTQPCGCLAERPAALQTSP